MPKSPEMRQEPELRLFDVDNLVQHINDSLPDGTEAITKGEYNPARIPSGIGSFSNWVQGRRRATKGTYDLLQGLRLIGRIIIETGETGVGCEYGGAYEGLGLRMKTPLALRGNRIIPVCMVGFEGEIEDGAEPPVERRGHAYKFHLIPVYADLSGVLPTGWFTGGRERADY